MLYHLNKTIHHKINSKIHGFLQDLIIVLKIIQVVDWLKQQENQQLSLK